jgi:hypothetical protein
MLEVSHELYQGRILPDHARFWCLRSEDATGPMWSMDVEEGFLYGESFDEVRLSLPEDRRFIAAFTIEPTAVFYDTYSLSGGPEEGGWSYAAGDLVAMMPVATIGEARALAAKLEDDNAYPEETRVTFDFILKREFPPTHFPEHHPHYE